MIDNYPQIFKEGKGNDKETNRELVCASLLAIGNMYAGMKLPFRFPEGIMYVQERLGMPEHTDLDEFIQEIKRLADAMKPSQKSNKAKEKSE